jgi:membrane fusion protein (multidrug efflux system)
VSRKKTNPLFKIVVLLALAGGSAWGVHETRLHLSTEKTDDAYITGHIHQVSAGVAGPLLEVLVDDNQTVKRGQVLARVDPQEFVIMEKKATAAKEQATADALHAKAQAAEATSAVEQAEASITAAAASVEQSKAQLAFAKSNLDRDESLGRSGVRAISQSDLERTRNEFAAAKAGLDANIAKLESARAGKDASAAAVKAAEAAVRSSEAAADSAEASIEEARRQQQLAVVTAPADGRIGNKNAETGNRVLAGQNLFAVVEDDLWVVGNFKETQLEHMQPGQSVDIAVDALGGRHFSGKVESFSPSTGAQFALLPPDNATGNFTKVVQRVPVKIHFDAEAGRGLETGLRPGLSTVLRVSVN